MRLPGGLNPIARRVAEALVQEHPWFGQSLRLLEPGHFEASLPAPAASKAGALVRLHGARRRDLDRH
jgi:hypothetical protein